MDPSEIPVDSDALRANSPGPPRGGHPRSLPAPSGGRGGLYGVRTPLTETLAEYFHTFRNADLLIDGFQTILLRNWTYFERSEDRARAFALLSELVLDLLERLSRRAGVAPSPTAPHLVLGRLGRDRIPMHTTKPSRTWPSLLVPLRFASRWPSWNATRSSTAWSQRAARRPALEAIFSELYRSLLLLGYRRVKERLPIPEWAISGHAELTDPQAVATGFAAWLPNELQGLIARAKTATTVELLSADLPTFSAILDQAIDQVFRIDNSRGPLRRLPVFPQGRHPRLSPERSHGRPAGRSSGS